MVFLYANVSFLSSQGKNLNDPSFGECYSYCYYHDVFCEFVTFDAKYNVSRYLNNDFKEMTKVYLVKFLFRNKL